MRQGVSEDPYSIKKILGLGMKRDRSVPFHIARYYTLGLGMRRGGSGVNYGIKKILGLDIRRGASMGYINDPGHYRSIHHSALSHPFRMRSIDHDHSDPRQ